MWHAMQVDTFEAVKNNVYSVLGDLAKDLNGPELDLLFSKFEACTGWPAPDTLKAMDLLKQLAHSDDKVRLSDAQAPWPAKTSASQLSIVFLPLGFPATQQQLFRCNPSVFRPWCWGRPYRTATAEYQHALR